MNEMLTQEGKGDKEGTHAAARILDADPGSGIIGAPGGTQNSIHTVQIKILGFQSAPERYES